MIQMDKSEKQKENEETEQRKPRVGNISGQTQSNSTAKTRYEVKKKKFF